MKIYHVGGSVRDMLLKIRADDNDYVVVGADIETMENLGFKQVGKDFPVFLHPITKEEYALARKEVKGKSFLFGKDVLLKDDLKRRDFTCNSLAYDMEKKEIIDFNNGQEDIRNKILRHIDDEYFKQDPLRVFRMCRFVAKLNFKVAKETLELSKVIVKDGMLESLAFERVFKEIEKSLYCKNFHKFILTAKECGALKIILPEIDALWEEKNVREHMISSLKQAAKYGPLIKFAIFLRDIDNIKLVCRRLKVPNIYRDFALFCAKNRIKFQKINEISIEEAIEFVLELSKKDKIENLISVCFVEMVKRKEEKSSFEKNVKILRRIYKESVKVMAKDMPNFTVIQKEENFKYLFKDYKVRTIKQRLEDDDE